MHAARRSAPARRGLRAGRRPSCAEIGGDPFNMTVAGLRLARAANAVAAAPRRDRARDVGATSRTRRRSSPSRTACTSPTWQDPRVRRGARQRRRALEAHAARCKGELVAEVERAHRRAARARRARPSASRGAPRPTSGPTSSSATPSASRASRRAARVQLVFAGKAHPADHAGKAVIARLVAAIAPVAGRRRRSSRTTTWGSARLLTRGADVWLNTPRPPLEASGTSGMKAALNGVLNCSILDGWWPEGCEHGVRAGPSATATSRAPRPDARDLASLYASSKASAARLRGPAALARR